MKKGYLLDYEKLEFETTITAVRDNEIVLECTYFFPGGGNQLNDTGCLYAGGNEIRIVKVYEREDVIYHVAEGEIDLKAGEQVQGTVDKERRKYLTTLHTAQHVISRIVFNKYRLNTVSVDMGLEGGTVAFSAPIMKHWIEEIRQEFARITKATLPIKNEIRDNLITVNIGKFDSVLCAGTHLSNTEEMNTVMIKGLGKKNNVLTYDAFNEYGRLREYADEFYCLKYMLGLDKNVFLQVSEIIDNYNEIWDEMYQMCRENISSELRKSDNIEEINGFKASFLKISGGSNAMKFYRKIIKKTDYDSADLDICVFSLENQFCIEVKNMSIDAKLFTDRLKSKGILIEKGGGSGRKVDMLTKSEHGLVVQALKEILGEI